MKSMTGSKKAAIGFLTRDCEKTLPGFLKKINKLRAYFGNSRVFIVENGSKDTTRDVLEKYRSSNNDVILYAFDDPDFDTLSRMERMTFLRNKNIDMVRESTYDPDYYIVIDGDLDFNPASIIRAIDNAPNDWSALFANGRYYLKVWKFRIPVLYYDLFAYLPETDYKRDSLTETEMLGLRTLTQRSLRKTQYLKCRSAFGGVGVYKYNTIGENRYSVERNMVSHKFDHLCEHITFNREIAKKGTLYVCRNLKVYYEQILFNRWLVAWAMDNNREKELGKIKKIYHKLADRHVVEGR